MQRGICESCGTFYIKRHETQSMCDTCTQQYEKVRNYIFNNNPATIMSIYLDTRVPIKLINQFINKEKIAFADR
ncbi:hypothetical protein [Caldisalinibacter kiritimatiensis]|uniref:Flagellar protein n=1 Tax=Caldisalinibacter kiritimatiensis TaxID=1304284 RepID=R1ARC5_9FIRM|nr:hypothetical protein [Caldisalinibacter kiritimatiensis]EOC99251.1 hypothetical protein L21TH_2715 [Caldisalinibacter kiritimatiensis]